MTELLLGVSKIEITPLRPVLLAGFKHRTEPAAEAARRLFARVCFFEQRRDGRPERFLLISADLIWWGAEMAEDLIRRLAREWDLHKSRVILHGTHTHGSPQTGLSFPSELGMPDRDYLDYLRSRILAAVKQASDNREPVRIERGLGEGDYGINRRKSVNGAFVMAPNPEGVIDKEIVVFRFTGEGGTLKAVLAHYACHPTTTDETRFTSEYCGVAMEELERRYGAGMIAAFLQGCCGDVRPALIRDGAFYRGSAEDVERGGLRFAGQIAEILGRDMEPLEAAEMASVHAKTALPFAGIPQTVPLRMTLVRLAKGLAFLTLNGEVVTEYGLYIKALYHGDVLPLPYSNGMIGYIPTAAQVGEGGYEGRDSYVYFGLPAPFSPKLEARIHAAIRRLGRKLPAPAIGAAP